MTALACACSGPGVFFRQGKMLHTRYHRHVTIQWAILGNIHWTSDNPLENTADKGNSIGTCHWKSTMISEVSISGVQYFAPDVASALSTTLACTHTHGLICCSMPEERTDATSPSLCTAHVLRSSRAIGTGV